MIMGSTCSCCIALTWAGVKYHWDSPQVLVPLCSGIVAFAAFVVYELKVSILPTVPFHLLTSGTCIVGYLTNFLNSLITMAGVCTLYSDSLASGSLTGSPTDYFPVYLQACKGQSAARAGGVGWLGFSLTVGPWGILAGVSVALLKRYVPVVLSGWLFVLLGLGLWTTLAADTPSATIEGFEALFGVRMRVLSTPATHAERGRNAARHRDAILVHVLSRAGTAPRVRERARAGVLQLPPRLWPGPCRAANPNMPLMHSFAIGLGRHDWRICAAESAAQTSSARILGCTPARCAGRVHRDSAHRPAGRAAARRGARRVCGEPASGVARNAFPRGRRDRVHDVRVRLRP